MERHLGGAQTNWPTAERESACGFPGDGNKLKSPLPFSVVDVSDPV
jgi:hypothetical protein